MKKFDFINLLSFVLCLISFLWLCRSLFLGLYPDFSIYVNASQVFLKGLNPYIQNSTFYSPYIYPPIVLILFVPFAFISISTASVVWTFVNLVILVLSLLVLSSTLGIKVFSKTNLILMSLVFVMFPVKFTLGMGQINILVYGLVVGGMWFLKQKKDFFAGMLIGACLLIKLFPILLPVYFLLKFEKKILAGMIASLIVALFFTAFLITPDVNRAFVEKVIPGFFGTWKLDYYGQSLGAFIGRSFGTELFGSTLKNILTLVIVGSTFFVVLKNKQKDFLAEFLKIGTLITSSLLINTYSWQHHFVWLIIPFYVTFAYINKKKMDKKYYILLFVSYLLVSINFKDPNILPVILQSHVFFGSILLFIISSRILFLKHGK